MSRVLVYSGVSWLGKIPDYWSTCRVKNKFLFHKIIAKEKNVNYDRIALTLNGVIKRDKNDSSGLQPDNYSGYQVVYKDDLIFKLIDLENVNTSRIGKSEYEGITSPAYLVLTDKCNTRYSLYYFLNMWYQEIFNNIGGDGVRSAINKDDLLKVPYINISIDEQNKIANYLDKQCAKIDEIIKDNNREIELLNEYRKNYVSEIVVDNKNKKIKLKHLANIVRGGSPRPIDDYLIDSSEVGTNWIKIGDTIKGSKYIDFTSQKIKSEGVSKSRLLHKGDFILSNSMSFGQPYILNIDGCIHDGWLAFKNISSDILKDYLYYFLISDFCMKQFSDSIAGAVVGNLNIEKVKNTIIYLPNIEIQKKIVEKLNTFCNKIDEIITYRKQIIEKLEEYKKSLIYECVTGKREV